MWNDEYNIHAYFFADLSKFKGGGLSLGRRHTESYEVCPSSFFSPHKLYLCIFQEQLQAANSRIQVLSAVYNRISVSLLRVTSLQFRSRLLPRAHIIVAVNCARTWVVDNHLEATGEYIYIYNPCDYTNATEIPRIHRRRW